MKRSTKPTKNTLRTFDLAQLKTVRGGADKKLEYYVIKLTDILVSG